MNVDIGLPVEQLRQQIGDWLNGDIRTVELSFSTVNRRSRTFQAKVTCSSLVGKLDKNRGVIVLVEKMDTPE